MKRVLRSTGLAVLLTLAGCHTAQRDASVADAPPTRVATAIFAGGCFWCLQADFDQLPGVVKTEAGYTGGHVPDPSYGQVSGGGTGHAEAVRVLYDPEKLSYERLLDYFWHQIDPTVMGRQFCDVGDQYRSAIFYQGEAQRAAAQASKAALEASRFAHVYTEIVPAGPFYPAEDYHQEYYRKNPIRYNFYRTSCGRDARLNRVWGANPADPRSTVEPGKR